MKNKNWHWPEIYSGIPANGQWIPKSPGKIDILLTMAIMKTWSLISLSWSSFSHPFRHRHQTIAHRQREHLNKSVSDAQAQPYILRVILNSKRALLSPILSYIESTLCVLHNHVKKTHVNRRRWSVTTGFSIGNTHARANLLWSCAEMFATPSVLIRCAYCLHFSNRAFETSSEGMWVIQNCCEHYLAYFVRLFRSALI
jgi:hypothetical protein